MLHGSFKQWIVNQDGMPVLNPAYRFLFSYGGRGGGKSEFVAEAILLSGSCKRMKILCAREFMNSIDDSVLSVLEAKADKHFKGFYSKRNNKLYGRNGTIISFKGLARNIGSIKSLDGYDLCWIEEGQYLSARAWELLEPTIRKAGSQFIITMNRESDKAILDKVFIQDTPPDRTLITKVNLENNPFDTPILDDMSAQCKERDLEAWNYIWGGELNLISRVQILHGKWVVEDFETPKGVTFYHGADWSNGGSHPHAFSRSWIDGKKNILYIDWELKTHADTGEELWAAVDSCPSLERKHHRADNRWRVKCDGANPANGRKMAKAGFRASDASKKFQGHKSSVQAGIEYFRRFNRIVIHTRCADAKAEAEEWKWKVDDRTGEILPIRVDAWDDIFSSIRYAHVENIRKGL